MKTIQAVDLYRIKFTIRSRYTYFLPNTKSVLNKFDKSDECKVRNGPLCKCSLLITVFNDK